MTNERAMKVSLGKLILGGVLLGLLQIPLAAADAGLVFQSVKSRAMGGVGVAITDDETALYKNPATIGGKQAQGFKFLKVSAGFSEDALSSISELSTFEDKSSGEQSDFIKSITPATIEFDAAGSPLAYYGAETWAFGVFAQGHAVINSVNKTNPMIEISSYTDISPMIGMARSVEVLDKDITVGVSARYISRESVYDNDTGENTAEFTLTEILDIINNTNDAKDIQVANMSGFGVDLGALVPVGEGNVGIAIKNIGSTLTGTRTVADKEGEFEQEIPVEGVIGWGSTFGQTTVGVDYKFISSRPQLYNNLAFGIEHALGLLKLRGGIYRGYLSGGVGMKVAAFSLDYAYYVDDTEDIVGVNPVPQHLIQIGVHF